MGATIESFCARPNNMRAVGGVGLGEGGFHGSQPTQLIPGTDPPALIALGGFVPVVIVTMALFIFVLMKLPSRPLFGRNPGQTLGSSPGRLPKKGSRGWNGLLAFPARLGGP